MDASKVQTKNMMDVVGGVSGGGGSGVVGVVFGVGVGVGVGGCWLLLVVVGDGVG